jgi:hypothetical protein
MLAGETQMVRKDLRGGRRRSSFLMAYPSLNDLCSGPEVSFAKPAQLDAGSPAQVRQGNEENGEKGKTGKKGTAWPSSFLPVSTN